MTLRVYTFNPRLRGVRSAFKLRGMPHADDLWLSAKDAGQAIGWHPDTFRHRREVALDGDAWGYATLPTAKGNHMMVMVSRGALRAMLSGVRTRQGRVFRGWLKEMPDFPNTLIVPPLGTIARVER
ncbi:hypothetical protein [Methylobacterium radiodurans]|uniref:hypothetical protein n=1 Tax=Methylobacterium radiodurans TaxID=2202828 RepID=UPI0013A5526A|nr:hypothetical protein [Methylobacterium radiodurans]